MARAGIEHLKKEQKGMTLALEVGLVAAFYEDLELGMHLFGLANQSDLALSGKPEHLTAEVAELIAEVAVLLLVGCLESKQILQLLLGTHKKLNKQRCSN